MLNSRRSILGGVPIQWNTFLDTPPEESDPDNAKVFVVPAPYDSTTSYKSGARNGPRAIIEASRQLEDYDVELDRDISLIGIHTTPEISPNMSGPKAMIEGMCKAVRSVAELNKLVALLGGEHTITIGAVQAMAQVYSSLSVLYLDAHADLRDEYMGTKWGHASVARRVYETCPVVHVGVRSLSAEEMQFVRNENLPVQYWDKAERDSDQVAQEVLQKLTDSVYISVDLDVLDPSIMSAVGTPEPGGMYWHEVTAILRTVASQRKIVGFDLTELSPAEGPESCAYAAAKLAYKLMGYATQVG